MLRRIAAIAAFGMTMSVQSVSAGQCGYEYCWGALSVGDLGAAGRASGMRSAPEAAAQAMQRCGSKCDGFEIFVNSCGAFAEDATGLRSFGWEADRANAEERALTACRLTGKGCRIRIWACSR